MQGWVGKDPIDLISQSLVIKNAQSYCSNVNLRPALAPPENPLFSAKIRCFIFGNESWRVLICLLSDPLCTRVTFWKKLRTDLKVLAVRSGWL